MGWQVVELECADWLGVVELECADWLEPTFPRVSCRSRGALAAVAGCFFLPKVRVDLHKTTAQGASI